MTAEPTALGFARHTSCEHSMCCRGELFTFLAEGKDTGGAFLTNDAAATAWRC